jgi:hypothetical protein
MSEAAGKFLTANEASGDARCLTRSEGKRPEKFLGLRENLPTASDIRSPCEIPPTASLVL